MPIIEDAPQIGKAATGIAKAAATAMPKAPSMPKPPAAPKLSTPKPAEPMDLASMHGKLLSGEASKPAAPRPGSPQAKAAAAPKPDSPEPPKPARNRPEAALSPRMLASAKEKVLIKAPQQKPPELHAPRPGGPKQPPAPPKAEATKTAASTPSTGQKQAPAQPLKPLTPAMQPPSASTRPTLEPGSPEWEKTYGSPKKTAPPPVPQAPKAPLPTYRPGEGPQVPPPLPPVKPAGVSVRADSGPKPPVAQPQQPQAPAQADSGQERTVSGNVSPNVPQTSPNAGQDQGQGGTKNGTTRDNAGQDQALASKSQAKRKQAAQTLPEGISLQHAQQVEHQGRQFQAVRHGQDIYYQSGGTWYKAGPTTHVHLHPKLPGGQPQEAPQTPSVRPQAQTAQTANPKPATQQTAPQQTRIAASQPKASQPAAQARWAQLHQQHQEHEFLHLPKAHQALQAAQQEAQATQGKVASSRRAAQMAAKLGHNDLARQYQQAATEAEYKLKVHHGKQISEAQKRIADLKTQSQRIALEKTATGHGTQAQQDARWMPEWGRNIQAHELPDYHKELQGRHAIRQRQEAKDQREQAKKDREVERERKKQERAALVAKRLQERQQRQANQQARTANVPRDELLLDRGEGGGQQWEGTGQEWNDAAAARETQQWDQQSAQMRQRREAAETEWQRLKAQPVALMRQADVAAHKKKIQSLWDSIRRYEQQEKDRAMISDVATQYKLPRRALMAHAERVAMEKRKEADDYNTAIKHARYLTGLNPSKLADLERRQIDLEVGIPHLDTILHEYQDTAEGAGRVRDMAEFIELIRSQPKPPPQVTDEDVLLAAADRLHRTKVALGEREDHLAQPEEELDWGQNEWKPEEQEEPQETNPWDEWGADAEEPDADDTHRPLTTAERMYEHMMARSAMEQGREWDSRAYWAEHRRREAEEKARAEELEAVPFRKPGQPLRFALEKALRAVYARHVPAAGQRGLFREEDHPRGQPENKGEFVKKGSESGGKEDAKPQHQSWSGQSYDLPTMTAAARGMSARDFLDEFNATTLAPHLKHKRQPPQISHGTLPTRDIDPSEWPDWNYRQAGPDSKERVAGMRQAAKNKTLPPVIVEGLPTSTKYRPMVWNGHHRVAAHIEEGVPDVPVVYTVKDLARLWSQSNGKPTDRESLKQIVDDFAADLDRKFREESAGGRERMARQFAEAVERYARRPAKGQTSLFDEELHPREPAGSEEGGRFTKKDSGLSPFNERRKVMAEALEKLLGNPQKAEELAKEIGPETNEYIIAQKILDKAGPTAAEIDAMTSEQKAAMPAGTDMAHQVLDALHQHYTERGEEPGFDREWAMTKEDREARYQRSIAESRAKAEAENRAAAEYGRKHWEDNIPAHVTTPKEWAALSIVRKLHEIEEDHKAITSVTERYDALNSKEKAGEELTDAERKERNRLLKKLDSPAFRKLCQQYPPFYKTKQAALNPRNKDYYRVPYWQAASNVNDVKVTMETRLDQGLLTFYDDAMLGYNPTTEHAMRVRGAVETGKEIADETLRAYAYESWMPEKYREKMQGVHIKESWERYIESREHAHWVQELTKTQQYYQDELAALTADIDTTYSKEIGEYSSKTAAAKAKHDDAMKKVVEEENRGMGFSRETFQALNKAAEEWAQARKAEEAAIQKAGKSWVAKLLPKNNAEIELTGGEHLSEKGKANLREAVQFLQSAVGSHWGKVSASIGKIDPARSTGGRAYAEEKNIALGPDDPAWTIIHEFGHIIEHQHKYALGALSKTFAIEQIRKAGEKVKHLGPGYEPSEYAAQDHLIAPYAGKWYSYRTSEVLSMGIQKLYQDPIGFYQKAPEHFKYTLACLHGFML